MNAFARGFQLGGDLYDSAERMKLAREQEARQAAESKARLEQMGLQTAALRRVDQATDNLDRLTRLGVQNPEAIRANDEDFERAVQATGQGLPMPAAAPQQPEWRAATGIELNQAQMGLAAARGDVQGMETLRQGRKGLEFEDGYKRFTADWNKLDDAGKAKIIDQISYDTGIKGFGTWVPGAGKQVGYVNWLPPGGDPIKLSASEARELYVLGNLMQIDPLRARAEMDKVSDKVRMVAGQVFDAQSKGVNANNQATRFANADDINRQELGVKREELGIKQQQANTMRDYYGNRTGMERMGSAQYFQGEDGNQYAAIPTMTKNGLTFQTVRVNPEGIKLGGKPGVRQVDPKEYSATITNFVNAGLDLPQATMRADQLYGLTAPTKEVAEQLRALDAAKARPGGAARAPAQAPAPAQPVGLQQRLSQAIATDNAAGNRNRFADLADEGIRQMPSINAQLGALYQSLPLARTAAERASLEARIVELESDASLYNGIITQRRAQMGQ